MNMRKERPAARFSAWETAALLALCLSLLWGCWAQGRQNAIAAGLVRLHVIAASDSEEEQALKLRVRDAVLDYLRPRLEGAESAGEARELLAGGLAGVQAAAESAAEGRRVRVSLGREDYPAREYGGFTLPAGRYESLRVILGPGEGRNWWCVVFPPLCLEAAETEALQSVMSPEDYALVCREEDCELRFWLVDLWGALMNRLR
jgi:stage II sporulation protein R